MSSSFLHDNILQKTKFSIWHSDPEYGNFFEDRQSQRGFELPASFGGNDCMQLDYLILFYINLEILSIYFIGKEYMLKDEGITWRPS